MYILCSHFSIFFHLFVTPFYDVFNIPVHYIALRFVIIYSPFSFIYLLSATLHGALYNYIIMFSNFVCYTDYTVYLFFYSVHYITVKYILF